MPTATAFKYHKRFSPMAHCPAQKTTAQLNAMVLSRWEGTESEVMALWWNLYTVDMGLQVSGESLESETSSPVKRINGSFGGFSSHTTLAPRDRVCFPNFGTETPYFGLFFGAVFDAHDGDGDTSSLWLSFQRVYYNTNTSKYALMYHVLWNGPAGNLYATVNPNLDTSYSDANGYVDTGNSLQNEFLGQQIWGWRRASKVAEFSLIINNPVYYTY